MYVYGRNVVKELLEKNKKIINAYVYEHFTDKLLISALEKKKIPIQFVTKKELDRLANGNHQGIMVSVPDYQYVSLDEVLKENALLVMLDHIEDPHNFGAIIRTCEAAGVDGIILPKNRSVLVNATVVKTSAGATENMPIVLVTNLKQTIDLLKKKGFWFVGTDMNGVDFEQIDYRGPMVLVIGNEGEGMSRIVRESCDFIASIPMQGKVNSLNASVAAGIMIYEAIKQRR